MVEKVETLPFPPLGEVLPLLLLIAPAPPPPTAIVYACAETGTFAGPARGFAG
jgi:hypothetical protein